MIKDVEIDNTKKWSRRHWHCLRENYYRSKYWHFYSPFFAELFKKKWHRLADLDMEVINFCVEALGIDTEIVLSRSLKLDKRYHERHGNEGDVTDRNIFYVRELGGKRFYEGALGKKYLDVNCFLKAGIEIIFQDYNHPVYKQRFHPFIPYLSVVDLLFNHGPESLEILLNRNQNNKPDKSTHRIISDRTQ
jgi:hypothetical protein